MAKKYTSRQHPSALKELGNWLLQRWKAVVAILGSVVLVFTSAGAIKGNWDAVEPGLPALRYYVVSKVKDAADSFRVAQQSQTSILRDLQIESTEGKRSTANNSLANWKLEKLKTKDPTSLRLIDQQIEEKEAEVGRLNEQLKTLNTLRSQGK